jgi:hypothetical protein
MCRRPTNGATVPAMSSVRVRLKVERHIRENAQALPRAERGFFTPRRVRFDAKTPIEAECHSDRSEDIPP